MRIETPQDHRHFSPRYAHLKMLELRQVFVIAEHGKDKDDILKVKLKNLSTNKYVFNQILR